jgi:hypothetical protein
VPGSTRINERAVSTSGWAVIQELADWAFVRPANTLRNRQEIPRSTLSLTILVVEGFDRLYDELGAISILAIALFQICDYGLSVLGAQIGEGLLV